MKNIRTKINLQTKICTTYKNLDNKKGRRSNPLNEDQSPVNAQCPPKEICFPSSILDLIWNMSSQDRTISITIVLKPNTLVLEATQGQQKKKKKKKKSKFFIS